MERRAILTRDIKIVKDRFPTEYIYNNEMGLDVDED